MNGKVRCLTAVIGFCIVLPLLAADGDDKSRAKLSKDEQAVLDLVNKARAKEALPALRANALLTEAARNHSKNMARQKKLEHVLDDQEPSDRVAKTGYAMVTVGENIAAGVKLAPRGAFDLWMNSPPHKKNILSDEYAEIGIGLARDDKGNTYYTQVFGTERGEQSNSEEDKAFKKVADKILELTNKARAEEGLKPLRMSPVLTRAARNHSRNMAKQDKLEHVLDEKTPSDRAKSAGYPSTYVGENIAYNTELDAAETFDTWINSPPHKKNILREDYKEIGIGMARTSKGVVYYTQVFGAAK